MDSKEIIAAQHSPEMQKRLLARRSCSVKMLESPAPSPDDVEKILTAAARVPDHGKLFPWHFIVFEGERRKEAGALLEKAWLHENPDALPAKLELEAARFMRAPLVIGVVSRARPGKHPFWEQILSAGAVCQNLCLMAGALGYGSNWLTEWYSYSPAFKQELGLDERDHIAGFIYIGTATDTPDERPRPELQNITTYWKPGVRLNKGDGCDQISKGFPRSGFDFSACKD